MKAGQQRLRSVQEALLALGLSPKHLNAIAIDNPSSMAPYHNTGHCCTVALNCLEGAAKNGLSHQETRLLFIAGLYHDYDHSQGKCSDDINIAQAIRGMRNWCEELEDFDESDFSFIESAIKATIVPYELFTEKRNLFQSIICDSDHMQYLEPDAKAYMAGLEKEMGIPVTLDSTSLFLSAYKAHTAWGRRKLAGYFASGLVE